jgi:membrane-bound lytic murein transglycosylase A
MSRFSGSCLFKIHRGRIAITVTFVLIVGTIAQAAGPSPHAARGPERNSQFAIFPPAIFGPSAAQPEPLRLPDAALEPIEWSALKGWPADDHAAAFATFLTSCRPLLRSSLSRGDKRPMYRALIEVCHRALAAGRLTDDQARLFLERNFRPLRITRLGDNAGLLTG